MNAENSLTVVQRWFPDLQYAIMDSASFPGKVWIRYRGAGTQKGAAWGWELNQHLKPFNS